MHVKSSEIPAVAESKNELEQILHNSHNPKEQIKEMHAIEQALHCFADKATSIIPEVWQSLQKRKNKAKITQECQTRLQSIRMRTKEVLTPERERGYLLGYMGECVTTHFLKKALQLQEPQTAALRLRKKSSDDKWNRITLSGEQRFRFCDDGEHAVFLEKMDKTKKGRYYKVTELDFLLTAPDFFLAGDVTTSFTALKCKQHAPTVAEITHREITEPVAYTSDQIKQLLVPILLTTSERYAF